MPYQNIWLLNLEGVWPEADPFFWFIQPQKKVFPVRVLNIRTAARLGDKKKRVWRVPFVDHLFSGRPRGRRCAESGEPRRPGVNGPVTKVGQKVGLKSERTGGRHWWGRVTRWPGLRVLMVNRNCIYIYIFRFNLLMKLRYMSLGRITHSTEVRKKNLMSFKLFQFLEQFMIGAFLIRWTQLEKNGSKVSYGSKVSKNGSKPNVGFLKI